MAKVFLKDKVLNISLDEATRVNDDWNKKTPRIKIGDTVYRNGDIKRVELSTERKHRYSLDDPNDRKTLRAFEIELRNIETSDDIKMDHPLEWYGSSQAEYAKRHNAAEKEGYVFNPMLGLTHWRIVQYCVTGMIFHKSGDTWAITDSAPKGSRPDISAFSEFFAKYWGLRDLQHRREKFERSPEEIDSLLASADVAKSVRFDEEIEDTLIETDELPI